jgi:hypothetical protein
MLPERFHRLHAHEENLRAQSIAFIGPSDPLSRHASAVEVVLDTLYFLVKVPGGDQDMVTVQLEWCPAGRAEATGG